jgi:hypothetical protein
MRIRLTIYSLFAALSLAQGAESPARFPVGEFKFQRPEKWEWIENAGPMRKAQLKIPGTDGKTSAEVVFFHFGAGGGGGTKANVDRWLGQFQERGDQLKSKVEEVTVRNRKVTYVEAQGTYMSGTPGGPKTAQPDSTLLGAIIESDAGSVFIKLTGPSALAKAAAAEFRKMAESGIP